MNCLTVPIFAGPFQASSQSIGRNTISAIPYAIRITFVPRRRAIAVPMCASFEPFARNVCNVPTRT